MRKILAILFTSLIFLSSLILCLAVVKGEKGNPIYYQKERLTTFGGPFELSISAGRFALTEAIVKNHSLFLTYDLAKFSAPDVAGYHGKYFSLFTPGLSFIGVPFYLIGLPFGMPQLSAYFLNVILAITNVFLIAQLCKRFNIKYIVGILGGIIFLFATNSLAYTSSFTQHHLTITVMLVLLLLTFRKISHISAFLIGILYGFGAMIDIPNIFMYFPIVIYTISQLVSTKIISRKITVSVKTQLISLVIGILLLFGLFAYYNYATTGSFTKVAQFIGQTKQFRPAIQNKIVEAPGSDDNVNNIKLGLNLPFKTRSELFGMYILLFSDERSWLFYSPIILLGFLGIYLGYKNPNLKSKTVLLIGIIGTNVVLYSMFGDPWGGWAFGSRYLLPSASLLCVFLAIATARFRRNIFYLTIFVLLVAYSLQVSLLGALTTIAVPPKVEATHLLNPVPYTWQYNLNLINSDYTSSLMYNLFFATTIQAKVYFYLLYGYCAIVIALILALVIGYKDEK